MHMHKHGTTLVRDLAILCLEMICIMLLLQMVEWMSFDPVAMEYYPTIWFNEFWLLRDYLIPMNETVTQVPLTFTLTSISLSKFSLMSQMDQAFSKQGSQLVLLSSSTH